jgi:hypothetical protein
MRDSVWGCSGAALPGRKAGLLGTTGKFEVGEGMYISGPTGPFPAFPSLKNNFIIFIKTEHSSLYYFLSSFIGKD